MCHGWGVMQQLKVMLVLRAKQPSMHWRTKACVAWLLLQVQPQGNSESFLPPIAAPESTLRKQQAGAHGPGGKKGGIRSLQHQGSDRWAESKRAAGMVAYTASRWN